MIILDIIYVVVSVACLAASLFSFLEGDRSAGFGWAVAFMFSLLWIMERTNK